MRRKLSAVLCSIAGQVTLGSLLIGAAVVVVFSGGEHPGADAGREQAVRSATRYAPKALRPGFIQDCERLSLFALDLRKASPREVRDQLPDTLDQAVRLDRGGWRRCQALFRRFGELEGEQALDEIVGRYRHGQLTVEVMTQAVIGWMEVDRPAALAAFGKLMKGGDGPLPNLGIAWKGTLLTSGFG